MTSLRVDSSKQKCTKAENKLDPLTVLQDARSAVITTLDPDWEWGYWILCSVIGRLLRLGPSSTVEMWIGMERGR